jgi:hypothetical protein
MNATWIAYQFMKDNGYDAVKKSGYVGSIIENGEIIINQFISNIQFGPEKAADYKIMVNARPGSLRNERPNLVVSEAAD